MRPHACRLAAGDIVVVDGDGVVVVPRERVPAVIEKLVQVKAAEAAAEARVNAGLQIPEWMERLLASPKVLQLD